MSSSANHKHLHGHEHGHSHDHQHSHVPVVLAPPALRSPLLSGVGWRLVGVGGLVCTVWLVVLWAL